MDLGHYCFDFSKGQCSREENISMIQKKIFVLQVQSASLENIAWKLSMSFMVNSKSRRYFKQKFDFKSTETPLNTHYFTILQYITFKRKYNSSAIALTCKPDTRKVMVSGVFVQPVQNKSKPNHQINQQGNIPLGQGKQWEKFPPPMPSVFMSKHASFGKGISFHLGPFVSMPDRHNRTRIYFLEKASGPP